MGDSLGVSHRWSSPCSEPISYSINGANSVNGAGSGTGWYFGDADIPNGIVTPNGCNHLASENVPNSSHQNGDQAVSNGFEDAVQFVENGGASHRHSTSYLRRAEVNAGSRREGCQGNTTKKKQLDSELASENVLNASSQNADQGVANGFNDAAQWVENGGPLTEAEVNAGSRREGCPGNTTEKEQSDSELTSETVLNAPCQNADQGVSKGFDDAMQLVENGGPSHRHSASPAWRVEVRGGWRRKGCEGNTTKTNGKSRSEQSSSEYGDDAYEGDDTDVGRGHHGDDNHRACNDEGLSSMEGCITSLLQGLGEDVEREGLLRTPFRVAKALQFFTEGYGQTAKDVIGTALFHEDVAVLAEGDGCQGCAGVAGVVVVRDIDLSSICIGCLSPLRIRCHVGYVPSQHRIVGLSKLPRIGEMCARRLQSPWRMADNLAESVHGVVPSHGVGVVVEAWHLRSPGSLPSSSSSQRRLQKHVLDVHGDASGALMLDEEGSCEPGMWVHHVEGAARGILQHNQGQWDEFLASLKMDNFRELVPVRSDSWLQKERRSIDSCDCWCRLGCKPDFEVEGSHPQEVAGERRLDLVGDCAREDASATSAEPRAESVPSMLSAVESLLYIALKGNLPWNAIKRTAIRYVQWLLWSTREGLQDEVQVSSWKSLGPLVDSGVPVSVVPPHTMASELCLPFSSLCEHHLLPFYGQVHVAYVVRSSSSSLLRQGSGWEQEEQVGVVHRRFLKQIVSAYSRRLQVQERLGRQVARRLVSLFDLLGVMVVLEANHLCMMARGVKQVCSNTFSTAMLGCFSTSPKLRAEFLRKLPKKSMSRDPV